jgi:hypothetical protein
MKRFLSTRKTLGAATVALLCVSAPVLAEDKAVFTTGEDVRAEISEAMEAVADYSDQERDQAVAEAREAMTRLDAELDRRGAALRDNWSDLSESARDSATERLRELREARNALGERYGALQTGAASAWGDLTTGFSDAWKSFADAWDAADEETS